MAGDFEDELANDLSSTDLAVTPGLASSGVATDVVSSPPIHPLPRAAPRMLAHVGPLSLRLTGLLLLSSAE